MLLEGRREEERVFQADRARESARERERESARERERERERERDAGAPLFPAVLRVAQSLTLHITNLT